MRFSVIASAALAACASATFIPSQNGDGIVFETTTVCPESDVAATPTPAESSSVHTEVVTSFVTYCPEPTTIIHGTNTYTLTEPGSLTIPGPVTVTRPIITRTITECVDCPSLPTGLPPAYTNGTNPIVPPFPTPSAPVATPSVSVPVAPPAHTGAASRAAVSVGALAGVFGIAAFLL
ncbi:hypothetical protein VTO42DRAFT_1514 [Malbranchea cinnamomea]